MSFKYGLFLLTTDIRDFLGEVPMTLDEMREKAVQLMMKRFH